MERGETITTPPPNHKHFTRFRIYSSGVQSERVSEDEMRIKFITREPRKGEAVLLTDEGQELERVPCYAHTATGKLGAIRHFEDVLLKTGKKQDELRFSFTEVKE